MHTRRRVLATTGTALSTLAASAAVSGVSGAPDGDAEGCSVGEDTTDGADANADAADSDSPDANDDHGSPLADADDPAVLLDPTRAGGTFSFVDLHALREAQRDGTGSGGSGATDGTDDADAALLDAVESAIADELDPFGVDPAEVLGYAAGDGYVSVTGTFDAVAVRLQLLFGSYDGAGEHAGFDLYVDPRADRALALADGELLLTAGALGTASGIERVVDVATGSGDGSGGGSDRGAGPSTAAGSDSGAPVEALHDALAGGAFMTGRRLADGEGPAGADAMAVERRFDAGSAVDAHAYAFDRPGAVPLSAVENHVIGEKNGEKRASFVAGDCAVVEMTGGTGAT